MFGVQEQPAPERPTTAMDQHPSVTSERVDIDATCAEAMCAMPDQLGGVELQRLIGEGGMGRVYLGYHPFLDVAVAVKVMLYRSGDRKRFLTEARLAARVQHEHIVRILHAGDEEGYRYLILEFVPGSNLKELVCERGRLPWREAAGFLLQAARGLAAAHRQGIIHRDVKPSNLLLGANGQVKVADLGVARALISSDERAEDGLGTVVGTPAYMAPEQAFEPHAVTPTADVYGLGATFYFLLTGEVPYPNRRFDELLRTRRDGVVPDPRRLVPDLPSSVRSVVLRMLAHEPDQRPADGAAVVVELERVLGMASSSTSITPRRPAPRGRRLWWVATAASLAGISTLLLGWSREHEPSDAMVAAAPADSAAAVIAPSPTRAVFTLNGPLPAAALSGLSEACRASGLPVVERARIEAIAGERHLLGESRLNPAAAVQLGPQVGGHIALFAEAVEDLVAVRCVLVETGEVVASRLVPAGETRAAAEAALATAVALLPVHAALERLPAGVCMLAGTRHGLRIGDQLVIRRQPGGPEVARATISAVEPNRATLAVLPSDVEVHGAVATRLLR